MDRMITLAIIPIIVWIGVFGYLLLIDRKLARLESQIKEDDL